MAEHNGKVIVIKDCQVLGAYDNHLAAFTDRAQATRTGNFLGSDGRAEGNEAYTATFYSPVIFPG